MIDGCFFAVFNSMRSGKCACHAEFFCVSSLHSIIRPANIGANKLVIAKLN